MGNTTAAAKKPASRDWSSFLFLQPGSVYGVECVHFPLVFEGMTKALVFSLSSWERGYGEHDRTAAKKACMSWMGSFSYSLPMPVCIDLTCQHNKYETELKLLR